MRVATWNLNVRKNTAAQVALLEALAPDVVVLQEVALRTMSGLREGLAAAGLAHWLCGRDNLHEGAPAVLDRFVAVASRWPLDACPPAEVPAAETVVCATISAPFGAVDIVGVHIPTIGRGLPLKLATQEGVAVRLREAAERPHIFCGDLNSPKGETAEGQVIPFSSKRDARVLAGELSLLSGLAEHGMRDAYRAVHGYGATEDSWCWKNRGATGGFRLDHIFASQHFRTLACWYDHEVRANRLSDHSLMTADLELFDPARGRSTENPNRR